MRRDCVPKSFDLKNLLSFIPPFSSGMAFLDKYKVKFLNKGLVLVGTVTAQNIR